MGYGNKSLNDLRDEAHDTAVKHGFKDASIAEDLALMHSELSEALEDVRSGHAPNKVWYEEKIPCFDKDGQPIMVDGKQATVGIKHEKFFAPTDVACPFCEGKGNVLGTAGDRSNPECSYCHGTGKKPQFFKPCGIPSEIADVIIRALHFSGKHRIDIEQAVREKMLYNETRPYKHGGKTI
jgi:hypothetical protein